MVLESFKQPFDRPNPHLGVAEAHLFLHIAIND